MQIAEFRIEGYKNLVAPMSLDGLGTRRIVVIHGPNNVGKSNLLEALQLPFILLGLGEERKEPLPFQFPWPLPPAEELRRFGLEPTEWFTLGAPSQVDIRLVLTFTDEELRRQGIKKVYDCQRIEIELRIDGYPSAVTWQILRYRFNDGADAAAPDTHAASVEERTAEVKKLHQFALYFARNVIWKRFVLLNLHRELAGDQRTHRRGVISDALALALFDARESPDPREYQRWAAFVDVCRQFDDVLGSGEPVIAFDRLTGRATLFFQSSAGRLPAHLLGTGVQQLLAIAARILVTKADVIAVEEPEASVSVGLHARVRDALSRMTVQGPSQIFLTSHSPWFDDEQDFIAVTPSENGPMVQWRSPRDAPSFTMHDLAQPPTGRAPVSYVTSEGLVSLPVFVREALGVSHGGGVVFWSGEKPGRVEIVSDTTALDELGAPADDQR